MLVAWKNIFAWIIPISSNKTEKKTSLHSFAGEEEKKRLQDDKSRQIETFSKSAGLGDKHTFFCSFCKDGASPPGEQARRAPRASHCLNEVGAWSDLDWRCCCWKIFALTHWNSSLNRVRALISNLIALIALFCCFVSPLCVCMGFFSLFSLLA